MHPPQKGMHTTGYSAQAALTKSQRGHLKRKIKLQEGTASPAAIRRQVKWVRKLVHLKEIKGEALDPSKALCARHWAVAEARETLAVLCVKLEENSNMSCAWCTSAVEAKTLRAARATGSSSAPAQTDNNSQAEEMGGVDK